jgi:LysR family transcriptional activator of glutamate synthase operon
MELRLLRYLVAIAEEGQFTRAAATLNIAQPALSQQIQKLERQVGMALVDRTTRRVSLTPAGEILVDHGRRMLAEAESATAELRELAGLETGRLVVGASPTLGAFDLTAALAAFHQRHPGVELVVKEDLSLGLAKGLHEHKLDLGFITAVSDDWAGQLDTRTVASEDLACIVGVGHPLARRRSTSLAELREEPFAMFQGGATIRLQLDQRAEAMGFLPRVAFETNDLSRIRELVSRRLAVAVIPRSDAERPGAPVAVLKLRDAGLKHAVFLAWRRGRRNSPAARRFMELVLAAGLESPGLTPSTTKD